MEVRMAMLSSGGELSRGVAPMGLSLVEGPGSNMEGRVRGSAKSEEETTTANQINCTCDSDFHSEKKRKTFSFIYSLVFNLVHSVIY